MSRLSRYWLSQPLLFGVLLAALVLRALIPAGYMPSSGDPFALEICKAGFPAYLLSDADDRGDRGTDHSPSPHSSSSETCPFGSAPAAGPVSEPLAVAALFVSEQQPETQFSGAFITSQRFRVQQPRAPPVHA